MRAFRAPARGSFGSCRLRSLFFQQRKGDVPRPGAGHFWPQPLTSATVGAGVSTFQSKKGSEKRSSGVISRPPLGGGWQREALTGGEKTAYYVSPSVKTEGFDTSLTEGGKDAPAGAAGRCGHRPLRTGTRSAIVQRLSLRHGFAVPPPSQREAKGNDSKTVGTHNLYKRNKEELLCLHPELLPSSFSWY